MNAIWYAIARVAAQDRADLRQGKPIREGAFVAQRWLEEVTLRDPFAVSSIPHSYTPTDGS